MDEIALSRRAKFRDAIFSLIGWQSQISKMAQQSTKTIQKAKGKSHMTKHAKCANPGHTNEIRHVLLIEGVSPPRWDRMGSATPVELCEVHMGKSMKPSGCVTG